MRIEVGRRAAVVIGLLGCTGIAATVAGAAIPRADGTINGCYERRTGLLRVIDGDAQRKCLSIESSIEWNQEGPQGAPGVQGPPGPKGDGVTRYTGSAEVAITPRDDSAAPSGEPIVQIPELGWLRVNQCVSQTPTDPAMAAGFAQAAFENTSARRLYADTGGPFIEPGDTAVFGDAVNGAPGAPDELASRLHTYLLADEGMEHVAQVTMLVRFRPQAGVCNFDASVVTY